MSVNPTSSTGSDQQTVSFTGTKGFTNPFKGWANPFDLQLSGAGIQKELSDDLTKLRGGVVWGFAALILLVMADTQLYPLALFIAIIAFIYLAAEGLMTPLLNGITALVSTGR